MKITLPLDPETVIEPKTLTVSDIAKAFAENAVVRDVVKDAVKDQYFEAFPVWSDMEGMTIRELGQIYLRGGADQLNDHIATQYASEPDSSEIRNAINNALEDAYQAVYDAVSEAGGDLEIDLHDEVQEAMSDDIATWMSDNDTSNPTDIIPNHAEVEVAFAMDYGVLGIDDLHTEHFDHVSSLETVVPNANFLRFLKLINMAPSEYIAICVEEGRDPSVASYPEDASDYRKERADEIALEWQAVLDVERGTSEHIRKLPLRSKYEIDEWNSRVDLIRTIKDYDRPVAISDKDVVTIMDNATYGGVASFVARLPLKDLVADKFSKPFLAKGGFVGLHHFGNGSGYIEGPREPVLIDPAAGQFFIASARKDAIDDVYGIVGSYYKISAKAYDVPEWRHVGADKWLRKGEESAVEITRSKGADGAVEFWVQSLDADYEPAGPRETAEVFTDFEAAKAEGDAILDRSASPSP